METNYLYAFSHGIKTFIKYNYFHQEQKRNFRNDRFCLLTSSIMSDGPEDGKAL
ncbi:hypothetical protein BACPLE_03386 [Phocaeicola plebeius DSM 17135]|uniref:Uncharacterized protein n=1 Tax=Phocaeicola plebeius (strain DSM 17135 / JCM 12973 / CCUG 54634 / M2) TaxID=484018 RepID=B5D2Z6_PHOPM|nr:hypothetical protein BACPLE_03386 [Phocaeicola plebeius DSM 17135]